MSNLDTLFSYDPNTGLLRWKTSSAYRIKPGDIAGSMNGQGYLLVQINGKKRPVHRIAWEIFHGEISEELKIDHVNGIRHDNRIINLRQVTDAENNKNARLRKDNSSGRTGVSWHKKHNKWLANIRVNGTLRFLEYFSDLDEAIKARSQAETDFGFHENHGRKNANRDDQDRRGSIRSGV